MGRLAGLLGKGKRNGISLSYSALVPSPEVALFPPNTTAHEIMIPRYFRSHKIATERFQLLLYGSVSKCWEHASSLHFIHTDGDSSFLLFLISELPLRLLTLLPSSSINCVNNTRH